MAGRSIKRKGEAEGQGNLFAYAEQLYPVRRPEGQLRSADLSLRIKSAMGDALKACAKSAEQIAAEIAMLTGRPLSVDALYTYTAPSKPEHEIGITRFVAFVQVTGANWVFDELAEPLGLVVLEGREAHFAQRGLLEQRRRELDDQIKKLDREMREAPVSVARRRL